MTAKEKNDREIGGKGKVFPSNFLYSGEIFPPRIPVSFTVGLKPLLVKVLLLSNAMNDTNGRGSALTITRIQTDYFKADVTTFTVFYLKRSSLSLLTLRRRRSPCCLR